MMLGEADLEMEEAELLGTSSSSSPSQQLPADCCYLLLDQAELVSCERMGPLLAFLLASPGDYCTLRGRGHHLHETRSLGNPWQMGWTQSSVLLSEKENYT